jgi:hypothetical protein
VMMAFLYYKYDILPSRYVPLLSFVAYSALLVCSYAVSLLL